MKKNTDSLISASSPKAQGRLTGNFILETDFLKKKKKILDYFFFFFSPLLLKTVAYWRKNLTQA